MEVRTTALWAVSLSVLVFLTGTWKGPPGHHFILQGIVLGLIVIMHAFAHEQANDLLEEGQGREQAPVPQGALAEQGVAGEA